MQRFKVSAAEEEGVRWGVRGETSPLSLGENMSDIKLSGVMQLVILTECSPNDSILRLSNFLTEKEAVITPQR